MFSDCARVKSLLKHFLPQLSGPPCPGFQCLLDIIRYPGCPLLFTRQYPKKLLLFISWCAFNEFPQFAAEGV